jgi:proton-translocating NAD(P)+ transhydrogenase subunit alpha
MDSLPVTIGVLKEIASGERRVALVPADIKRLSTRARFYVQAAAGAAAGIPDREYVAAGARVSTAQNVVAAADVLVKIRPPEATETLREKTVLICLGGRDPRVIAGLGIRSVTHLGLERLPRTTRAQTMDVLSSQAALAGYAAVLEGARRLDVLLPMMTTAAGTIRPAKMIALGAGVAGLQAIATARRLGAQVFGFDVREAAREQVESLGARFVSLDVAPSRTGSPSGYAAEQSDADQRAIRAALAKHLPSMQLIITSAQIPGRPAPLLMDEGMVEALNPGTVVVDMAAESGGNTTLTIPDEAVTVAGVHILGPTNLPSTLATDASRLFSANVRALLEHILNEENRFSLDPNDAIIAALLAGQTPPPHALAVA